MRLRLPELLEKRKPPMTPYALAKASGGRISLSTIYRLVKQRGRVRYFDAEVLEAMCELLRVTPAELLEHDGGDADRRSRRQRARPRRKRTARAHG